MNRTLLLGTLAATLVACGSPSVDPSTQSFADESAVAAAGRDDAKLIAASFPKSLKAGKRFTAKVTLQNVGRRVWRNSRGYALVALTDPDPLSRTTRIELPTSARIKPGHQHTFSWKLTAPNKSGKVRTSWQLVRKKKRFGPVIARSVRIRGGSSGGGGDDWQKLARSTWPTPQPKRATTPEVVNTWTIGGSTGDLKRLRATSTTAEIGLFLDLFWTDAVSQSADGAWRWLDAKQRWWDWRDFKPNCKLSYRKSDAIRIADYAGLHIELNFDSFAAGSRTYHGARANPKLADDRVYGRAVINVLDALKSRGIKVRRVWIENEPDYTERSYKAAKGPHFTEATYLRRVRYVAGLVRGKHKGVQIGAGGVDATWGIAAWRTRVVDRVGYHRVGSLARGTSVEKERTAHLALIRAFQRAGVPLSRLLVDEVNTPRDHGMMRGVVDTLLGFRPALAGMSWVTISAPRENGCAFTWAASTWGDAYVNTLTSAIKRYVRY